MEQIRACRICLITGVKLNDLRSYPLVNYCEAIVGMTEPVIMDLPPYACYECTAHIKNTFFFKERCLRGQAALYQILRLTGKITEPSINSVDRLNLNLISNIKHYIIADNSIVHIDECEVKDEPCSDYDLQEVKDVAVEVDDVFKDEIEFGEAASPVNFSSDDDDEPLSIHKSNNDKVMQKKTEKRKGRKRKADVAAEVKEEEAATMEEGSVEAPESSAPAKKRGRPKKGEARPKQAQPSISRRTRNTGGVEDNEIDLEEYVTVIKLSKEEQLEEVEKRQHSSNYRNAQYKCDQCFKGFIDADAWQHHVGKHKPDENPSVENSTNEYVEKSIGESSAMEQSEKASSGTSAIQEPEKLRCESSAMEQPEKSSGEIFAMEQPEIPSESSVMEQPEEHHGGSSAMEQPEIYFGESIIHEQPVTLKDEPASESVEGEETSAENVIWTLDQTFANAAEAESAVEEMGTWTFGNSYDTESGCKKYYTCSKFRKLGAKCPATVYLLFEPASKSVGIYKSNVSHDHQPKSQTKHTISEALETEIKNMFDRDMTAEEIMSEISGTREHNVPEMSQIKAYLGGLRRANLEEKEINLLELKAWINMHKNVPDNPQDVFVTSEIINEDDAEFLFVLSSKRLLEIAKDADVIHIDSRHKLIWQSYPVFVVGTTDRAQKFHPICLAVTSREQKDDFKLIFEGLKNRVHELFHGVPWKPRVLVSNAVTGIQSAFVEVFGRKVKVRTCWNQVHGKISNLLRNSSLYSKLFKDLDTLQSLTRPSTFKKASQVFVKKYEDLTQFVRNFEEQCLVQNRNWYVGAVPISPDTNNGLEAFVRNQTMQTQLNQCDFLKLAKEMVDKWSMRYIMDPQEFFFAKLAPITTWEWTKAYNWAKMPKEVSELKTSKSHIKVYKVPSGEGMKFRGFQYDSDKFKSLIKNNNTMWFIKLPVAGEYWQQGVCDCPAFFEKYICKHVIGMAIRLGHVTAPVEAQVYASPPRRRKPYFNPRYHCKDSSDTDSDEDEW